MDNTLVWFQQDGTTAHTARISMNFIYETFAERFISRNGDIPWPPRSPGLNPCDLYYTTTHKNRVAIAFLTALQKSEKFSPIAQRSVICTGQVAQRV